MIFNGTSKTDNINENFHITIRKKNIKCPTFFTLLIIIVFLIKSLLFHETKINTNKLKKKV